MTTAEALKEYYKEVVFCVNCDGQIRHEYVKADHICPDCGMDLFIEVED